ncbi:hypothetical protein [Ferruginibacter sp. SUN106]|uniref:hypothetical protein n=1 Tax=Ferruginibacter sp. SUN106 TaxID=2978348 RepID=UPI003D36AAE9
MKKTLLLFITLQFTAEAFTQNLDLKILSQAYNANSVRHAFEILKNGKDFNGKVFLTDRLGDSTVIVHFGKDSLLAKKQTGKVIIHCSVLNDEQQFLSLKQQATKNFKPIETAHAESMGVLRNHFVYGQYRPLKKGDLQIILTKCFDKERKLIYYQFNLLPYNGY